MSHYRFGAFLLRNFTRKRPELLSKVPNVQNTAVTGLISLNQSKSCHLTQWQSGILKHLAIGTRNGPITLYSTELNRFLSGDLFKTAFYSPVKVGILSHGKECAGSNYTHCCKLFRLKMSQKSPVVNLTRKGSGSEQRARTSNPGL